MKEGIVFRTCDTCGSAEDVLATTTRCPGCGALYREPPVAYAPDSPPPKDCGK